MASRIITALPIILACISFLPLGMVFGQVMLCYYFNSIFAIKDLKKFGTWPYITGGFLGYITGSYFSLSQHMSQTNKFQHFYIMGVGLLMIFIGSIGLATMISIGAIFLCLLGHGLVYVPALAYINIRSKSDDSRIFGLFSAHIWYLIGISVTMIQLSVLMSNPGAAVFPFLINISTLGACILFALLLIGFVVNEILHHLPNNDHNYKISLDHNIQREIESKEFLRRKYFPIAKQASQPVSQGTIEDKMRREIALTIFAFSTKLQSILVIYAPYQVFNIFMAIMHYDLTVMYIPMLLCITGLILSALLMYVLSYKQHYLIVTSLQIIVFIVWIVALSIYNVESQIIVEITWVVFIFLAMSRPFADIHLLTYTRLQLTEMFLGLAYLCDFLIFGIVQFITVMDPTRMLGEDDTFIYFMSNNVVPFAVIVLLLGIFGAIVMPSKTLWLKKMSYVSLLEIKNWINYETVTVPYNDDVVDPPLAR